MNIENVVKALTDLLNDTPSALDTFVRASALLHVIERSEKNQERLRALPAIRKAFETLAGFGDEPKPHRSEDVEDFCDRIKKELNALVKMGTPRLN